MSLSTLQEKIRRKSARLDPESERANLGLKRLTLLGAAMLLLFSLNPIFRVEEGYEYLYVVRWAAYVLFLAGAIAYPKRIRTATLLLGLGVAGRVLLELRLSLLKEIVAPEIASARTGLAYDAVGDIIMAAVFTGLVYLINFVLPCLLLMEAVREWARGRKE